MALAVALRQLALRVLILRLAVGSAVLARLLLLLVARLVASGSPRQALTILPRRQVRIGLVLRIRCILLAMCLWLASDRAHRPHRVLVDLAGAIACGARGLLHVVIIFIGISPSDGLFPLSGTWLLRHLVLDVALHHACVGLQVAIPNLNLVRLMLHGALAQLLAILWRHLRVLRHLVEDDLVVACVLVLIGLLPALTRREVAQVRTVA